MVFHMSFYKVDYECSSSESTFHTQDEFPGKSFSKEMIYSNKIRCRNSTKKKLKNFMSDRLFQ